MLENPVYPALPRDVRADVYDSDNVTGAENQQERLIEFRGWVTGFVDGEGCFSIGLVRQPDRTTRRGYKTGYQVSHDFVVTQRASSVESLHELREFFGVGEVYINQRVDNHREHLHTSLLGLSAKRSVGKDHSILPAEPLAHGKAVRLPEVCVLRRTHG